MDMFSVSREAAQHSNMDRKTSAVLDAAARKQSTFDRRPSADRRQSSAVNAFNAFRDEIPAVSLLLDNYGLGIYSLTGWTTSGVAILRESER